MIHQRFKRWPALALMDSPATLCRMLPLRTRPTNMLSSWNGNLISLKGSAAPSRIYTPSGTADEDPVQPSTPTCRLLLTSGVICQGVYVGKWRRGDKYMETRWHSGRRDKQNNATKYRLLLWIAILSVNIPHLFLASWSYLKLLVLPHSKAAISFEIQVQHWNCS